MVKILLKKDIYLKYMLNIQKKIQNDENMIYHFYLRVLKLTSKQN